MVPANVHRSHRGRHGVRSVTPDVRCATQGPRPPTIWPGTSPYDPEQYPGSMYNVAAIGADERWKDGYTGKGSTSRSSTPASRRSRHRRPPRQRSRPVVRRRRRTARRHRRLRSRHAHGGHHRRPRRASTHDDELDDARDVRRDRARRPVVNVKVAAADGAVDVSQVIAAINWVVEHRNDQRSEHPGAEPVVRHRRRAGLPLDPLTFAVEVVPGGRHRRRRRGRQQRHRPSAAEQPRRRPVRDRGRRPRPNGTPDTHDDVVADFSSRGNSSGGPTSWRPAGRSSAFVTPGAASTRTIRAPGPGGDLFKGSGTSHAAAVVSGAAAGVLQRYPKLTPDQVKYALQLGGRRLTTSDGVTLEKGVRTIELDTFRDESTRGVAWAAAVGNSRYAAQTFAPALGLGSIDAARGTFRLADGTNELAGEIDVTGEAWNPQTWSAQSLQGLGMLEQRLVARAHLERDAPGAAGHGAGVPGAATPSTCPTWSGRTWSGGEWAAAPGPAAPGPAAHGPAAHGRWPIPGPPGGDRGLIGACPPLPATPLLSVCRLDSGRLCGSRGTGERAGRARAENQRTRARPGSAGCRVGARRRLRGRALPLVWSQHGAAPGACFRRPRSSRRCSWWVRCC